MVEHTNVIYIVSKIQTIHSSYGDRISIEKGNFLLLWKLGFQDRLDTGDRVSKFLSKLRKPQPWNHKSIICLHDYIMLKLYRYRYNIIIYFMCRLFVK